MTTPPEDPMPEQEIDPAPVASTRLDPAMESRLSGAYQRILRSAIALSVAGTLVATLVSWQGGLGLAIGSLLAYINFVWLHRGTERLVERIIASNQTTSATGGSKPRKVRFAFPFPLRYALLIAVAYVILKSYPRLLIGFIVGLILPILAAMGEGIYEALVISKIDQASR
jgi:hypothetical protein